jgi:DNA-binding LacI/PurR family transcriptional regulator
VARGHRFQLLVSALRSQIDASYSPGETLPSERELASMHSVSSHTIHRALHFLHRAGIVCSKERVGWMRAATHLSVRKQLSGLRVGVITRRSADEWNESEMYAMLFDEARRRGIQIVEVPNRFDIRSSPDRFVIDVAQIPWNLFDVALFVESEETLRLRHPILLRHKVLVVDQNATELGLDSVAFADAVAGKLVAQHLLKLGHTRFAVTEEFSEIGYPCDPAWTARRHGFEAALSEAGAQLLPQWRLLVPRNGRPLWAGGGFTRNSHQNLVRKKLAEWAALPPIQRPTALFAISHAPISHGDLASELVRYKFRVPRDLSIISVTWNGKFWGGSEPVIGSRRLTHIDFDLSAMVRRIFDAVQELTLEPEGHAQRPPKLFIAPAILVDGESTGQAPN